MTTNLHGAGLGYKRHMAADFLNLPDDSPISFIEVAPENWLKLGGAARKQFERVAERFPVACHGLSLSLGGRDDLDIEFLKQIKAFIRQYNMTFFSEHLSYCSHNGFLYDLLPLPFTAESVRHTAERIRMVQDILEMQIAVENTSYYAHNPIAEMNEAEFLNAVVAEADCKIHLDVNNIYVNAVNHQLLMPSEFLRIVDLDKVVYMHMAGHDREAEDLLIDTHGQAVCDDVWTLFAETCRALPKSVPTLLERDSNFPEFSELVDEVARIDAILKATEEQRHER